MQDVCHEWYGAMSYFISFDQKFKTKKVSNFCHYELRKLKEYTRVKEILIFQKFNFIES